MKFDFTVRGSIDKFVTAAATVLLLFTQSINVLRFSADFGTDDMSAETKEPAAVAPVCSLLLLYVAHVCLTFFLQVVTCGNCEDQPVELQCQQCAHPLTWVCKSCYLALHQPLKFRFALGSVLTARCVFFYGLVHSYHTALVLTAQNSFGLHETVTRVSRVRFHGLLYVGL